MTRTHGGFTLLELIVSMGIVAILTTLLSQVFISTLRTNTKTEVLKDMKQNGDIAMETIVRSVQSAKSVTCDSEQSLTVEHADTTTTLYECTMSGSQSRLSQTTGGVTSYLTSENVTMGGSDCQTSSLSFTCADIGGLPASVQIVFTLARNGTPQNSFEQSSVTFSSGATMRNQN